MNKKGFVGDLGFILVAMLLFAIFVIIGYQLFTGVNEKIQADDGISSQGKEFVQDNKDRYVSLFDGIFLFVLALAFILLFISVINLDTHPAFFIIAVIVVALTVVGAAIMSNVYEDISTGDQLNTTSSEFTFLPYIFSKFPMIALAMGFILLAGLYVKIRGFI